KRFKAEFYRNGAKVAGAGGDTSSPFHYAKGHWIATWGMGWAPELGEYTAKIVDTEEEYTIEPSEIKFVVRARPLRQIPDAMVVVNLEENAFERYNRLTGPLTAMGRTGSTDKYGVLAEWVSFFDADAFWSLSAQSHSFD